MAATRDLSPVLEAMAASCDGSSPDEFCSEVMRATASLMGSDSAILILQHDDWSKPSFHPLNIRACFMDRYAEYYYAQDPFHFLAGPECGSHLLAPAWRQQGAVRMSDLVNYGDFTGREYYIDFLRPQEQHFKLMSCFAAGERGLGLLGVFRARDSWEFTPEEVHLFRRVSALVGVGLTTAEMRRTCRLQDELMQRLDGQVVAASFVAGGDGRILYCGPKARQLLYGVAAASDGRTFDIRDHLKAWRASPTVPTVESAGITYRVRCHELTDDAPQRGAQAVVVTFDEARGSLQQTRDRLRSSTPLTSREIDVVLLLLQGCTNAQIARRLFVTEGTVKKHLQNISCKTGARSRTAIISHALASLGLL